MQVNFTPSISKTNFKACGYKYAKLGQTYVDNYAPKPIDRPIASAKEDGFFHKLAQKLGLIHEIKEDIVSKDTFIINYDKRLTDNGGKDYLGDLREIKRIEREIGLDVSNKLFIIKANDSLGHPSVIFNTFFVNEQGEEVVRLYQLFTDSDKLTETQKLAYKLFYNAPMRSKMSRGNRNNPLKEIDAYNPKPLPKLRKIANSISSSEWDKQSQTDNGNALGPVIFSANGVDEIWFNKE